MKTNNGVKPSSFVILIIFCTLAQQGPGIEYTAALADIFMDNSLFENLNEEQAGLKLLESHRYWSRKRILFNIIIGITGCLGVVIFLGAKINLFDLFGIVSWGVVANALYSTGYILDSYIISKSKGERSLQNYRTTLFWLGTIAYVVVGFLVTVGYSNSPTQL